MTRRLGRGPREGGFTLLELMMASLIMLVVGGFGLFSLTRGRDNGQSRGLAEEIAEEIKAARQQAISEQRVVALAFPSAGNSTGKSQSFYQLEGISMPKITRSIDYAGTYPKSCFFWGSWGASVPESTAMSAAETEFDLATWLPLPNPRDYLLVFAPNGTVKSNGLPLYDGGEYRLLVSNGVVEGPGVGGGPLPLFAPLGVSIPYTVRVSKSGAVSVGPGVSGGVVPDQASLPLGTVGKDVPSVVEVKAGPQILTVRSEPKPLKASEQGAVTVVPKEGNISLVAEARDPSGGPLRVEWRAEGPRGTGKFSSEKPMSMTWDAKFVDAAGKVSPRWTSRVSWTPPEGSLAGELYTLTCYVRNPHGDSDHKELGTSASVEVVEPDKVACINTDDTWEHFYVAWLNPAGTNVISVTLPDLVYEQLTPVWSPNGTKLAFYSGKETPDGAFQATLYVVNDDGTGLRPVFQCKGDITDYNFGPSFSPDGSQITFSAYQNDHDNACSRVYTCNIYAGQAKVPLTKDPNIAGTYTEHTDVAWNPIFQRWILYTSTRYDDNTRGHAASSIRVYDREKALSRDLVAETSSDASATIGESHWSFDGKKLVFCQGNRLKVLRFNQDTGYPTGAPVDITPPISGFQASMPRFSPDDNQVAVVDATDGTLYVVTYGSIFNASVKYHKVTDIYGGIYGYNWSGDGADFVFSTIDNAHIFTVSTAGGAVKDVTPPGFNVWSTPSWWAP